MLFFSVVNVAKGKRAYMSSNHTEPQDAGRGVDDNMTSFFHTGLDSNPWWYVDLGSVFEIIEVRVFNRISKDNSGNVTFLLAIDVFQPYYITDVLMRNGRCSVPV